MTTTRCWGRSMGLAAAVLALTAAGGAGCGGAPAGMTETTGSAATMAVDGRTAAVGEPVELDALRGGDDEPELTVVVAAITPAAACLVPPSVAEPPEHGQFLRLDLTVTTGPGYDAGAGGMPNPLTGWSLRTPDGRSLADVRTYPASVCAGGDDAPLSAMRRDRSYRAVVVLDVPADLAGAALVLDGGGAGPDREWAL